MEFRDTIKQLAEKGDEIVGNAKKLLQDAKELRKTSHGVRGNDPDQTLSGKGKYATTRGNDPDQTLSGKGKIARVRGNDPKGDLIPDKENKGMEPGN